MVSSATSTTSAMSRDTKPAYAWADTWVDTSADTSLDTWADAWADADAGAGADAGADTWVDIGVDACSGTRVDALGESTGPDGDG